MILDDGPPEFSPGEAATARAQTRANMERHYAIASGRDAERRNATLRTTLSALAASGVALPRLFPGQLPAHVERNLDMGTRIALGLPPQ